jgi:hypothetical protein
MGAGLIGGGRRHAAALVVRDATTGPQGEDPTVMERLIGRAFRKTCRRELRTTEEGARRDGQRSHRVGQHSAEVDHWFDRYDNPLKELLLAVRDVVLEADDRVTEAIKWQAPTFMYQGNLDAKRHAIVALPVVDRVERPWTPVSPSWNGCLRRCTARGNASRRRSPRTSPRRSGRPRAARRVRPTELTATARRACRAAGGGDVRTLGRRLEEPVLERGCRPSPSPPSPPLCLALAISSPAVPHIGPLTGRRGRRPGRRVRRGTRPRRA